MWNVCFFNITIGIILFLVIFIINIFLCKKYYSWTATIIEILYEINFSLLLIINFFPTRSYLSSYNIIYLAGILFYTILQSYFLAGRKKEILNSNQLFLELFRRTWIDYKKNQYSKKNKNYLFVVIYIISLIFYAIIVGDYMLNSEDIRADFQNIYILILSLYIVTLISLAANRYFDRRDETNIFTIILPEIPIIYLIANTGISQNSMISWVAITTLSSFGLFIFDRREIKTITEFLNYDKFSWKEYKKLKNYTIFLLFLPLIYIFLSFIEKVEQHKIFNSPASPLRNQYSIQFILKFVSFILIFVFAEYIAQKLLTFVLSKKFKSLKYIRNSGYYYGISKGKIASHPTIIVIGNNIYFVKGKQAKLFSKQDVLDSYKISLNNYLKSLVKYNSSKYFDVKKGKNNNLKDLMMGIFIYLMLIVVLVSGFLHLNSIVEKSYVEGYYYKMKESTFSFENDQIMIKNDRLYVNQDHSIPYDFNIYKDSYKDKITYYSDKKILNFNDTSYLYVDRCSNLYGALKVSGISNDKIFINQDLIDPIFYGSLKDVFFVKFKLNGFNNSFIYTHIQITSDIDDIIKNFEDEGVCYSKKTLGSLTRFTIYNDSSMKKIKYLIIVENDFIASINFIQSVNYHDLEKILLQLNVDISK